MKLTKLIDKLQNLLLEHGDLDCWDAEFLSPINRVEVENIMRAREKEASPRLIIGRDE